MGFYIVNVVEIEDGELIEEKNVTKSESLLTNELIPCESVCLSERSDSVMWICNLNDACSEL